jgi:hypothetical protein
MQTLTDALDFISNFVPKPSVDGGLLYPSLNEGLTHEEIYQKTRALNYELPEEVYEIYQWSNGAKLKNLPYPEITNVYHDNHEPIDMFLSLENAIDIAKDWGNGSFPLFMEESAYLCFTIGSMQQQKIAPIFCSDESPEPEHPRFESLTKMMIKLVEALSQEK